jgi:hypothetical protein
MMARENGSDCGSYTSIIEIEVKFIRGFDLLYLLLSRNDLLASGTGGHIYGLPLFVVQSWRRKERVTLSVAKSLDSIHSAKSASKILRFAQHDRLQELSRSN